MEHTLTAIKGRVIDGTGAAPQQDGLVVIEGNRIKAVCRAHEYPLPAGARVLEVEDGTVLPGLITQHEHIGMGSNSYISLYLMHPYEKVCLAIRELEALLDAGFTTVRDCGGISHYLKAPLSKGTIKGPRVFAAGKVLTQTNGHFDMIKQFPVEYNKKGNILSEIVDGVDQMLVGARMNLRDGADFVKIMTSPGNTSQGKTVNAVEFTPAEIRAAVEVAENYGTYVSSHCVSNRGIKAAMENGVKSIEHGQFLEPEDAEYMVKHNLWYVPTLSINHRYMMMLDQLPDWVVAKVKVTYHKHYEAVKIARQAGVTIGFGADFGGDPVVSPHGLNGMEFERLVAAGLTPMEAIVAATRTGSKIVMNSEIGTLEEGKLADVILVKGNPLSDVALMGDPGNVRAVVLDGAVVKDTTLG